MKAREKFRRFDIISVLLILLIIAPSIESQNPTPSNGAQVGAQDEVVRMDTNLVTIPATVMDRDGRYITDLKKEEFQIFEDGVEQEVAFFAPVEQPFMILFLLDVSGSMTYKMGDLARAANAFVGQLRPHDQLMAASFSDSGSVNVLFQATKVSELRKSIKLRQGRDQHDTMIYDAVDDSLKRRKKVRGRNVIVLFSDGVGTGIFATEKSTLHKAEEQDTLIYTVQFDTYPTTLPRGYEGKKQYYEGLEKASHYMRDLAQKTGGRHYQVENISDLSKTFGQVADELRRQYSLGYYPKKQLEAGQRRQVKVKVKIPNVVVRARDSYLVEPSKKIRERAP